MSGFDPSAFVQAEQQSLPLSPSVAKPEPAPATVGEAAFDDQAYDNANINDGFGQPVAAVATVAGGAYEIADLEEGLPFAAELNRMFRFACPHPFKPSTWYRLRKSIRAFVADGKCGEALACGWEAIELFGFPAPPWVYHSAPCFMTGFVFRMRGLRAGEVKPSSIEIVLRTAPNWQCYKAHHMTGRASSLPCWEALDPARWPVKEFP